MASSFTPVDDIIQVDPSTLPPFPLHTQMNKLQINTYESPSRPQIAQISFQPQPNNYPLYYQTQPPWQQHVLPISYVPVTVTHNPNVSSPKAPFTLPLSPSTPLHMPNTSWHHSQPSTSSMLYNNPISVTTSDNHKTSFCPYRPFCRLCNNHHHRGLNSLCKGTTWDPFSTSQKTNVTKHKKGKINNNNNTSNNNL